MIDDMIRQLFDRDLSQSTVRYCQRILSVSLGCAVKYGYIDNNPAKNIITKFSKTSNVPDPYTIPQLQQFFAIVAGTKWEFRWSLPPCMACVSARYWACAGAMLT